MKTNLGELAKSIAALRRVGSLPYPAKTRFDLIKVLGKAERHIKRYADIYDGISARYGTKVNAHQYTIPREKQPEWQKELDELNALEVTFKGERFKLSDIEALEEATAADIVALAWLIEQPADEEEDDPFKDWQASAPAADDDEMVEVKPLSQTLASAQIG